MSQLTEANQRLSPAPSTPTADDNVHRASERSASPSQSRTPSLSDDETSDYDPYPETPKIFMAMPATKLAHERGWAEKQQRWFRRQEQTRQRRQRGVQRRGQTASPCRERHSPSRSDRVSPTAFENLPSELILTIMHTLDKTSMNNFIKSSRRVNALWKSNKKSIFQGMCETQFPEFIDILGTPMRGRNQSQRETMQSTMETFQWCHDLLTPSHPTSDPALDVSYWWNYVSFMRILQNQFEADLISHRTLWGDEDDGEESLSLPSCRLSRRAVLVMHVMSLCVGKSGESTLEEWDGQVRIFTEQPVPVQRRVLVLLQLQIQYLQGVLFLPRVAVAKAYWACNLPWTRERREATIKTLAIWIATFCFSLLIDHRFQACSELDVVAGTTGPWMNHQIQQVFDDYLCYWMRQDTGPSPAARIGINLKPIRRILRRVFAEHMQYQDSRNSGDFGYPG